MSGNTILNNNPDTLYEILPEILPGTASIELPNVIGFAKYGIIHSLNELLPILSILFV